MQHAVGVSWPAVRCSDACCGGGVETGLGGQDSDAYASGIMEHTAQQQPTGLARHAASDAYILVDGTRLCA